MVTTRTVLVDEEYDLFTIELDDDEPVDLTGCSFINAAGKCFLLVRSNATKEQRTRALDTLGWV